MGICVGSAEAGGMLSEVGWAPSVQRFFIGPTFPWCAAHILPLLSPKRPKFALFSDDAASYETCDSKRKIRSHQSS